MPLGAFRLNSLAKQFGLRTAKTVTANGNAQVSTAQNKFGGASALFDGTGDYLSVATSTDFGFGTGDFTIEGWFYKTTATTQWFIDTRTTTTQNSVAIQSNGSGNLRLFVNGSFVLTSSNTHTNNAWNHFAISRASGVTRFFINGVVSTNTYTDTTDYGATKPMVVGAQFNGTTAFNGYIDEFRVTKGLARYTTTFTPSTTAFVNDANTVLLLHCNGTNTSTAFPDDGGVRSQNGISAFGNAQISTAQSQFGGASALFDGNGDRIMVVDNSLLNWNTQPYTVEYWCRIVGRTSEPNDTPVIIGNTNPSGQENYWSFGPDNSGNLAFYYYNGGPVYVRDTDTMSLNVWYHCAAVITSNTIKIYLDGVEKVSAAISGTPQFGTGYGGLNIGWGNGATRTYNGYLDEVRISNTARYTAGFTPSTTAFVNDGNTQLLLHCNGTNTSTAFTDDNA